MTASILGAAFLFLAHMAHAAPEVLTVDFLPREPEMQASFKNVEPAVPWVRPDGGMWRDPDSGTSSLLVTDGNGTTRLAKFKVRPGEGVGSRLLAIASDGSFFFVEWFRETRDGGAFRRFEVIKVTANDATAPVIHFETDARDKVPPSEAVLLGHYPQLGTAIAFRRHRPGHGQAVEAHFLPASGEKALIFTEELAKGHAIDRWDLALHPTGKLAVALSIGRPDGEPVTRVKVGTAGESLISKDLPHPYPAFIVAANQSQFFLSSHTHAGVFATPPMPSVLPIDYTGQVGIEIRLGTKRPGFARYITDEGRFIVGSDSDRSYLPDYFIQEAAGNLQSVTCRRDDSAPLDVEVLAILSDGALVARFPYLHRIGILRRGESVPSGSEVICHLGGR